MRVGLRYSCRGCSGRLRCICLLAVPGSRRSVEALFDRLADRGRRGPGAIDRRTLDRCLALIGTLAGLGYSLRDNRLGEANERRDPRAFACSVLSGTVGFGALCFIPISRL